MQTKSFCSLVSKEIQHKYGQRSQNLKSEPIPMLGSSQPSTPQQLDTSITKTAKSHQHLNNYHSPTTPSSSPVLSNMPQTPTRNEQDQRTPLHELSFMAAPSHENMFQTETKSPLFHVVSMILDNKQKANNENNISMHQMQDIDDSLQQATRNCVDISYSESLSLIPHRVTSTLDRAEIRLDEIKSNPFDMLPTEMQTHSQQLNPMMQCFSSEEDSPTNITTTCTQRRPTIASSSFIYQTESYEELIQEGLWTFRSWNTVSPESASSNTACSPYSPASTQPFMISTCSPTTTTILPTPAQQSTMMMMTMRNCFEDSPLIHHSAMNLNNSNFGASSSCTPSSGHPMNQDNNTTTTTNTSLHELLHHEITNFVTSQTNPSHLSTVSEYTESSIPNTCSSSSYDIPVVNNTSLNPCNVGVVNPLSLATKKKKKKLLSASSSYSLTTSAKYPSQHHNADYCNNLPSSPQQSSVLTFNTNEYQSFSQGIHETQQKHRKKKLKFTEFNPHQVKR
ncbi:hypothetical protein C9374_007899 [Naegleria lovaniensis]|uniref:Uncharacterized protein n=1 Tax=Naegleria lovaniensis TaxID=51637 RepID=A0AA88GKA3_NAELO|nr:uncharacterized protein C9374_007899 [Naegleria lovaniensis]KAG2378751.1 hypothetical protein C9374_007899 [Naegleria lovaniensis]